MENFVMPVQIRWSDIDPNFHLRHSVYFDWGAMCRMQYLDMAGLSLHKMQEMQIGVIVFREECIYRKEIYLKDVATINLKITKARRDFSRFSIRHEVIKEPAIISATLNVDIAWINLQTRKLTKLPDTDLQLTQHAPFSEDFQWLD